MGLALQLVHQAVELGQVFTHEAENPADVHDDKGRGQNISDDRRGEGQLIGQAQGHPEGDASPELDDGDHGDEHGEQAFAHSSLGEPIKQLHNIRPFLWTGAIIAHQSSFFKYRPV